MTASSRIRFTLAILLAGMPACAALGAATDPSFLEQYAATYRFRLGRPTAIRVTPDGRSVLFLRSGPRSFVRNLYEVDLTTGRERVLLTAETILQGGAEALTAEEKARRERMRLAARGIASYELSRDGRRILVPLSGRLFVVDREAGTFQELESDAGVPIDPRFSPDGKKVACVRDGELYVIQVDSGRQRQITRGAGGTLTHGLAEFVAQEEMSRRHGFWWSPDSRRLLYQQTDTAGLEVMNIMDATHPETAPATWPYPRPGKRNASVRLGIVSAGGGATTWISRDRERYEYLASVKWPERGPLTLLVQNRRQNESLLLTVNPSNGSTSTLLEERDDAWLDIDQNAPWWLPDGKSFLWTTERNGAWELEWRGRDGQLLRTVTTPDLGFQSLKHYSPATNRVVVRAGTDPTQSHLLSLPLDEKKGAPVRLSQEPGVHDATFNRDGTVWVHSIVPESGPARWEVMTGTAPSGVELRSLAEIPPFAPRLEFTTVGDDPSFHAVLVRPRELDAQASYPVIVHVYGGPTSQMVRRDPGRYLLDQWMADHGYVVVAIDGRGTPNRGSAWQRAVKNDLIAKPLADQARALALLGQKFRELDLSRVGIYGWSFGGYFSAMAVMRRPDVFHVGVAGAPVVDWQDYDTHYTERYMDLPSRNPEGYRDANVLSHVDGLARPLLIIHGTADDNVYFMHSLKLSDALFRAGKSFEFLPLAGFTHMVPDPLVTTRLYTRIMDFLATGLARPARDASGAPANLE